MPAVRFKLAAFPPGVVTVRLTTYLFARILLNGGVVLAGALAWSLSVDHRDSRDALETAASAMQRILALQATGVTQGAALQPRFPDWYPVTRVARPDGACVRLRGADGALLRSACRGHHAPPDAAPAWFARVYRAAFEPALPVRHEIALGKARATLEVLPDATAAVAQAWRRMTALGIPLALLAVVLCVTAWWSARRALRPAQEIMHGLAALEQGAFETRLGPYRWSEFERIARASNALAASLAQGRSERARLSRRLLKAQEDERAAIARDLHDEFGQHLSAIGAQAAALRARLRDAAGRGARLDPLCEAAGDRGDAGVASIEHSARHLMQVLRGLLARLRPHNAGALDLAEALCALVKESGTAAAPGVSVTLHCEGLFDDVDEERCGVLYRIAQEALTNALRHADAAQVALSLTRDGDTLELDVRDDGRGAPAAALAAGYGIGGMRERAVACGAELRVTSVAGHGTVVRARMPVGTAVAA